MNRAGFFDLTLPELHVYQGRNPRPADFDDYWAAALAELATTPPAMTLEPAAFQTDYADCAHLYFTGAGGARVHAQLLQPKRPAQPGPALLIFHGYHSNSGDWSSKLGYVGQGFTVAALDCRGQGGLSEDNGQELGPTIYGHILRGVADPDPQKLHFRNIFLDTVRLAQLVMDLPGVDAGRVAAAGSSQGGALTLACAALVPQIKRIAPTFPFLCDYQRVWELGKDIDAFGEIQAYFRRFDPRHEREVEFFTRLGYIDVQHLSPRIQAEVLWSIGLRDEICPPSSQFAAYNRLLCAKQMDVYPEFGHENLPGSGDRIFAFLADL